MEAMRRGLEGHRCEPSERGRSVADSAPASMPVQDVAVRSHLGPLGGKQVGHGFAKAQRHKGEEAERGGGSGLR